MNLILMVLCILLVFYMVYKICDLEAKVKQYSRLNHYDVMLDFNTRRKTQADIERLSDELANIKALLKGAHTRVYYDLANNKIVTKDLKEYLEKNEHA